ncbi:hypothetical protein CDO52_06945 [Nocardiopsis gilva YIM 90087]|uniref:Uncharacterized protein n=1 Tax=Nocardiopsis gilva YIM 90087 TaxID=1235441 RepID=A0A223S352_9ACTN|nr:hypothetical protein [Nocardiopsis gilva]ASU82555.1 hypothetical protein CDO52_06945 [Nocardiopsis gilva YIM 90087]
MKLVSSIVSVFTAAAVTVLISAGPVHAATGEIIVFTTEFEEITVYQDPASGSCRRLPATAHTVINRTDADVFIHAGTSCFGPGVQVAPDRGWHAPPSGMFSISVD